MNKINLKIDKEDLEDHVKRICKGNLRKLVQVCTQCPMLSSVLEVMDSYKWKYNGKALLYEPCARTKDSFKKNRLLVMPSEDEDLRGGITEVKYAIFKELVPRLIKWYKRHTEAFEKEFYGAYGQMEDKRVFYTIKDSLWVVGCGGVIQKNPAREPELGEISDVYLLPKYRGKGLGKMLVRDLIFKARLLGFESLFLTTRKEFEVATKLYQRLGFRQIKNTKYKSKSSTAWELRL